MNNRRRDYNFLQHHCFLIHFDAKQIKDMGGNLSWNDFLL
jgi:hypothetical protein